jgi:hypothetical protein
LIELGRLSVMLAGAAGVSLGALGLVFLRDPAAGLRLATHRAEALPEVMANRYLAFAALAGLAVWHGDAAVVAALFTVLALMALHDAFLYARSGHIWGRHAAAGVFSLVVAGLVWFARAEGV